MQSHWQEGGNWHLKWSQRSWDLHDLQNNRIIKAGRDLEDPPVPPSAQQHHREGVGKKSWWGFMGRWKRVCDEGIKLFNKGATTKTNNKKDGLCSSWAPEQIYDKIVDAKLPKCLKYGNIYCFIFCTGKANYLLSYILGGDRSVHVYLDGQRVKFCSERISTVENRLLMGSWGEKNASSHSWWVKGSKFWVQEVRQRRSGQKQTKKKRKEKKRNRKRNLLLGSWEWEEKCFSKCLFSWMSSFFSIPESVIKDFFSLAIN